MMASEVDEQNEVENIECYYLLYCFPLLILFPHRRILQKTEGH